MLSLVRSPLALESLAQLQADILRVVDASPGLIWMEIHLLVGGTDRHATHRAIRDLVVANRLHRQCDEIHQGGAARYYPVQELEVA